MSSGDTGEQPPWTGSGGHGAPPGSEARRVLQAVAVTLFLSAGVAFSGWVAFGSDGESAYRAGPLPGVNESPGPTPSAGETQPSDDYPAPGPETGGPTDVPTDIPSGVPSPSATPFASPSAGPSMTGAAPPAGFTTEADPAGYHLSVPDGWRRTVEGPSVFYTSPDDDTRIQVFELHGPEATPYESAREAERIATRYSGYAQVALTQLGQDTMDPAQLEYTYDNKTAGTRRILDRRFAAPNGTMYAVLVIGPSDDRTREQEIHEAVLDSFCPTEYCTAS